MAIRAQEHQQGTGGLAAAGKTVVTGGGLNPGVSPVLKGGGTGGPAVQVVLMGAVRRDDVGGGGHPCEVYLSVGLVSEDP